MRNAGADRQRRASHRYFSPPRSRAPLPVAPRRCATEARGSAPPAAMASLFERQRADVESRLDAIVRGGEPVTSRALASLQGALGLDDVILDDEGVPRDAPGSDTRALVEHALCRLTQRVMQEEAEGVQECAADEGAARASVCADGDVRACPSCAAECEAADEYCRVCGARVRRLGARRERGGGVSREGGDRAWAA